MAYTTALALAPLILYTLRRQFTLVATGCAPAVQQPLSVASVREAFVLAPLDSRLCDEASTPLLNRVRFPNHVWQRVIRLRGG